MNTPVAFTLPALGAAMEGGFFAGAFNLNSQAHGLIIAPKALGRHDDAPWNESWDRVDAALSYVDGRANTDAMATAGSAIAQWARAQSIGGFNDWFIPAQDQLELLYRNLKPTTAENYLFGRSGLNVSTLPPTYPYTANAPTQTPLVLFQKGGEEALDPVWHWSSTQHAGNDGFAWMQNFGDGLQYYDHEGNECRVVLVRSIPL